MQCVGLFTMIIDLQGYDTDTAEMHLNNLLNQGWAPAALGLYVDRAGILVKLAC